MSSADNTPEYVRLNRANWDERAAAHAASPDYGVQRFLDDPSYLSGVVRFDLPLLGSVEGLRGVHLQCHIGTDTLSLARLGAQMTGLDFSPQSLERGSPAGRRGGDADRVRRGERLRGPEPARLPRVRLRLHRCRSAAAGCPTSPSGRRSSATCSGLADGSSSARVTRCCGRSTSHGPTESSSTSPTSRCSTRSSMTSRHLRRHRRGVPEQPHAQVEPRDR